MFTALASSPSSLTPSLKSKPASAAKSATETPTSPARIDPPLRSTLPSQSNQPSVSELAKYGIKVRDFAYESTLPPIASVRLPRQVQPGSRPLKRARKTYETDDDPFIQGSSQRPELSKIGMDDDARKSKLERKLTEPASNTLPIRARGFADLNFYDPPTDERFPFAVNSQESDDCSPSPSQQPPLPYFESQESEPYINTPLVTPNGSLQWPVTNTTSTPASQLDSNSQAPGPELLTYSQIGLSLMEEREITPALSSPLSSAPSSSLLLPLATHDPVSELSSKPSNSPPPRPHSPFPPETANQRSVSPRYFLRRRTVVDATATSSSQTPTKNTRGRNAARSAPVNVSPRRPAFSAQSSHARSLDQNAKGSPRSRTVRKGQSGAKESMIVG